LLEELDLRLLRDLTVVQLCRPEATNTAYAVPSRRHRLLVEWSSPGLYWNVVS